MSQQDPTGLDAEALSDVLGRGGVGVLAFGTAADEPPHALPVSYGYDAESESLYFRLATGADRGKRDLLENPATFTTYRETESGYQSVVASGRLASIEDPDVDGETLAGLSRVEIPLFDVFDRDLREVEFEFYRMDAADVTGKRELQVED